MSLSNSNYTHLKSLLLSVEYFYTLINAFRKILCSDHHYPHVVD